MPKSKVIILIILSFMMISPDLFSADSTQTSLAVHIGLNDSHIADKHVTPIFFSGYGIAPSLQFKRTGAKSIHLIEGAFYFNKMKASASNYRTEVIGGNFRYAYLRKLGESSVFSYPFHIAAGISLSSMMLKYDYFYYQQTFWATALESWYFAHSIDLAIQADYKPLKNGTFYLSFFLPMISNVSRPAYSPSGDFNYEKNDWEAKLTGKTGSLFRNPACRFYLEYDQRLSEKVAFKLIYDFYYAKYSKPEMIKLYINNLGLGMQYTF